jgi:acyl-CoA thioesterase-1
LMSDKLKQDGSHYTVINASVSGETTGGGLIRLPKTLDVHQPNILILELGGNDGLRGYPIDKIKSNLNQMIEMATVEDIRVLLVGMVLPPNYGRRYTVAFQNSFADVANGQKIALVPHLLEGVTTPRSLMQQDGIHPKAEAQWMILDDIYPVLKPLMSSDK